MVESALYLERREYGLGQSFHEAVIAAEKEISENPGIGRKRERGVRLLRIKRFPYGIEYREEEELIMIYAVAAFSKRPGYWKERLP